MRADQLYVVSEPKTIDAAAAEFTQTHTDTYTLLTAEDKAGEG